MKRIIALALILIICLGLFSITASADNWGNVSGEPIFVNNNPYTAGPVAIVTFDGNGRVVSREIVYPGLVEEYYSTETYKETNTNNTNTNTTTDTSTSETVQVPQEIPTELAKQIFELTNAEREKEGLNKLDYHYSLQDEADIRAQECSVSFSHTRPDGTSCHDIVTEEYTVTGENLAQADKPIATAENFMKSWMESAGHRFNILLPEFTGIAIGVYEKNDIIYVSQIFIG